MLLDRKLYPGELYQDDVVRVLMSGRADGNAKLNGENGSTNRSAVRMAIRSLERIKARKVVVPRANFSHKITLWEGNGQEGVRPLDQEKRVWRPDESSDGVIVKRGVAVAICNADCPVGVIHAPATKYWCMVHLGLRCLIPERGQSLLEIASEKMHEICRVPASSMAVWFGGGIGPCCYGVRIGDQYLKDIQARLPDYKFARQVKKGPRKGQIAIDLIQICELLAEDIGFSRIKSDHLCTSCSDLHYSHVLGHSERNFVMATVKTKSQWSP